MARTSLILQAIGRIADSVEPTGHCAISRLDAAHCRAAIEKIAEMRDAMRDQPCQHRQMKSGECMDQELCKCEMGRALIG